MIKTNINNIPDRERTYGGFHTRYLFIELCPPDKYDPKICKYTLDSNHKVVNGVKYLSLKRLYLEEEDISEYLFAIKYFTCWEHWETLSNLSILREDVGMWRKELQLRLKAKALKSITEEATLEGKNAFAANKFILNNKWDYNEGRPEDKIKQKKVLISKQEIKKEAARLGQSEPDSRLLDEAQKILNDKKPQNVIN